MTLSYNNTFKHFCKITLVLLCRKAKSNIKANTNSNIIQLNETAEF